MNFCFLSAPNFAKRKLGRTTRVLPFSNRFAPTIFLHPNPNPISFSGGSFYLKFEHFSPKIRNNEERAGGGLGVWGKDSARSHYLFLPCRPAGFFGLKFFVLFKPKNTSSNISFCIFQCAPYAHIRMAPARPTVASRNRGARPPYRYVLSANELW